MDLLLAWISHFEKKKEKKSSNIYGSVASDPFRETSNVGYKKMFPISFFVKFS